MKTMENPPQTTLIELTIDGSCARIELAREDKFNALNVEMITELIQVFEWTKERSAGHNDALEDANGHPYLRTLVLSGRGKHFCAGADINMMRDAGANTPEENRKDSERLDRLFNGLWSHPCFTIGAIQGVALGGGAGLIACVDYVVATENVRRPARGDDAGRPAGRAECRPHRAGRLADGHLRASRKPVRRHLHRLAGDEPRADRPRGRARGRHQRP